MGCKLKEKENMRFWRFLKTDELDQKRFKKIVKEVEKKIDCTKCGNCCKEMSPVLTLEDIERISKKLKISKGDFLKKYTERNEDKDIVFKLPCPFLQNNKCSIYEIRPKECKEFPHLDKDISFRCHQFFSNAEICPIVFNVLENAKEEFLEDIYDFENPEV
ncbi:YkgJ family cysteine cluster protein [Candidatus Woesearchaeota archaeon]|nr:MAG: YkgJ family cysteine cluster protein [Candidatus Woesearchaeota archaeon]